MPWRDDHADHGAAAASADVIVSRPGTDRVAIPAGPSHCRYLSRLAGWSLSTTGPTRRRNMSGKRLPSSVPLPTIALHTEGVLAWSDALRGDGAEGAAASRLRKAAAGDSSQLARFTLLATERASSFAVRLRVWPRSGRNRVWWSRSRRISQWRFREPVTAARWRHSSRRCFRRRRAPRTARRRAPPTDASRVARRIGFSRRADPSEVPRASPSRAHTN